MALQVNKIESILILEPGTVRERVIVNYKLGTSDDISLTRQQSIEIDKPIATENFTALKARALAESKQRHGI